MQIQGELTLPPPVLTDWRLPFALVSPCVQGPQSRQVLSSCTSGAGCLFYSLTPPPPPSALQCSFALVQYGGVIQTEFDLQESRDINASLAKVQSIVQVKSVTKTASAMQHVL